MLVSFSFNINMFSSFPHLFYCCLFCCLFFVDFLLLTQIDMCTNVHEMCGGLVEYDFSLLFFLLLSSFFCPFVLFYFICSYLV